jgi:hypothetical protein
VDALSVRADYNIGDLKNLDTLTLPANFLTDDAIAKMVLPNLTEMDLLHGEVSLIMQFFVFFLIYLL